MFNEILEIITQRKLCSSKASEELINSNEQIKLKFEMNLMALHEIFKKKEALASPRINETREQKNLQKQLDKITDWIYLFDKTQERLESEQTQLIEKIEIEPREYEKYSSQEIEDIIKIIGSME